MTSNVTNQQSLTTATAQRPCSSLAAEQQTRPTVRSGRQLLLLLVLLLPAEQAATAAGGRCGSAANRHVPKPVKQNSSSSKITLASSKAQLHDLTELKTKGTHSAV
jgi:hypothetical protein